MIVRVGTAADAVTVEPHPASSLPGSTSVETLCPDETSILIDVNSKAQQRRGWVCVTTMRGRR